MSQETITLIISLVAACVTAVGLLVGLITAIRSGELKNFVIEQMKLAEQTTMTGAEKLAYVIKAVKDKYKLLSLVTNVQFIVEKLIDFSKSVNSK